MKKNLYLIVSAVLVVLAIVVSEVDIISNYLEKHNKKEPIKIVKVIMKQVAEEIPPVDLSKCINNPVDDKERIYSKDQTELVERLYENNKIEISEDKKTVTITTGNLKSYIEDTTIKYAENENPTKIEITGFNSEVKQVLLDITGNAGIVNKILFLLKDGTIQYAENNYLTTTVEDNNVTYAIDMISETTELKTIQNVTDVVALYNGGMSITDEPDGTCIVIASKEDGSFYNLSYVTE